MMEVKFKYSPDALQAEKKQSAVTHESFVGLGGRCQTMKRHWFHVQVKKERGEILLVAGKDGEPAEFQHYRDAAAVRDSLPEELSPQVVKIAEKRSATIVGPFDGDAIVWERGLLP